MQAPVLRDLLQQCCYHLEEYVNSLTLYHNLHVIVDLRHRTKELKRALLQVHDARSVLRKDFAELKSADLSSKALKHLLENHLERCSRLIHMLWMDAPHRVGSASAVVEGNSLMLMLSAVRASTSTLEENLACSDF